MANPVCFMVMPFSTKPTGLTPGEGPTQVDFDALWEEALSPAIKANGYVPVRADQDAGALIIVEMIERLALSDLVVADISIGNANVYYEIGIRHAAKQYGCVLLSANWARVLFDIQQMPRVVYEMKEGKITADTASQIKQQVSNGIKALKDGESPVWQAVPDYPQAASDDDRVTSFQAEAQALNDLLGKIRSIRRTVEKDRQKKMALALRDEISAQGAVRDGIQIEMMEVLRDCVGWQEMVEWINAMPERLQERPSIQEQRWLALSKSGDPQEAIGAIEQLIKTAGDSSERQGLLGGRYKVLYTRAQDPQSRPTYLNRAIDHYEQGVLLDLNDYYPACNLPRLYRERNNPGDADRARIAGAIALKGCERSFRLNPDDPWLRPTMLGAAFDAQDPSEARRLTREVKTESPDTWKLETTIRDLRLSTEQVTDPHIRSELVSVFHELNLLLPQDKQLLPLNVTGEGESHADTDQLQETTRPLEQPENAAMDVRNTLQIPYPESLPTLINQSKEEFEQDARLALAYKLYEMGRLTSGQAASLGGVSRAQFLLESSRFGVASVIWDAEEIEAEFADPDNDG